MNFVMNHTGLIISLLGGMGAIVAALLKGVKPLVKWGIGKALSDPKWNHILTEYRVEIEGFFNDIDSGVKEGLDQASLPPK